MSSSALNQPEEGSFALGLYDLDGFKAYNDAFGHPAGDALLARLGRRIADAMSGRGTAYRMGGDEFCVFTWAADSERVLEDARLALCDKGEGFAIRCSCWRGARAHGGRDARTRDPDRRRAAVQGQARQPDHRHAAGARRARAADRRAAARSSPRTPSTSPTSPPRPRRGSASQPRRSPARASRPSCTTSARRRCPRRSSARPARSTRTSGTSCSGTP